MADSPASDHEAAETQRRWVEEEVEAIHPFDDVERQHRLDTLAWIRSGVEICRTQKPATPPKHLVSYFVVIDRSSVLLVDHKNANLWLPTGGHVEPGEHPRTTVAREAGEELGIEAKFLIEAPCFLSVATTVGLTAGHVDVSLWYVLRGAREQSLAFDRAEFREVCWFSFRDAPFRRSDPNLRRFLTKLSSQNVLRPPLSETDSP